MDARDETLIQWPPARRDSSAETTLHILNDSVPDLALAPAPTSDSGENDATPRGFLMVLLRALSAWNV